MKRNADVAQSVVRRIGSAEVTGPIPVISFAWQLPGFRTSELSSVFMIYIYYKKLMRN